MFLVKCVVFGLSAKFKKNGKNIVIIVVCNFFSHRSSIEKCDHKIKWIDSTIPVRVRWTSVCVWLVQRSVIGGSFSHWEFGKHLLQSLVNPNGKCQDQDTHWHGLSMRRGDEQNKNIKKPNRWNSTKGIKLNWKIIASVRDKTLHNTLCKTDFMGCI